MTDELVDLLAACKAIHHQLTLGEASEGDLRDIAWCAETARAAIDKAEKADWVIGVRQAQSYIDANYLRWVSR